MNGIPLGISASKRHGIRMRNSLKNQNEKKFGTVDEVKSRLRSQMELLCETFGFEVHSREGNNLRYNSRGSLCVTVSGPDYGRFYSHEAGVGGGPIDFLMWVLNCDFLQALEWAKEWLGCPENVSMQHLRPKPTKPQRSYSEAAMKVWRNSGGIVGTSGASYLNQRGISLIPPESEIRFNPQLRWRDGDLSGFAPALVFMIRNIHTGQHQAIQRRYLNGKGGKLARFPKAKSLGPTKGGAVMLTGHRAVNGLNICEGVEDALSVMELGWSGGVWALCGTSGLHRLNPLDNINAIRIFADSDEAGIVQAEECVKRWRDVGKVANWQTMPGCYRDVNEYLMAVRGYV